jgi:D-serine deaminase-like pyridoxal phosphate-dependent protein
MRTAAAPSASAAGRTCPAAFQALTIEQAVAIKLALGYPLTPEELEAALRSVDANRDEIVCSRDLPDTPAIPPFISNVLDNKARVP